MRNLSMVAEIFIFLKAKWFPFFHILQIYWMQLKGTWLKGFYFNLLVNQSSALYLKYLLIVKQGLDYTKTNHII
jgi:hypothetical protein